MLDAGKLQHRGRDIHHVENRLLVDRAGSPDPRTADDQWRADAALRQEAFVQPEWSHSDSCPTGAILRVCAFPSPHEGAVFSEINGRMERPNAAGLAAEHGPQIVALGPVVGEEDDDGVVVLADLLQVVEEPPDVPVEVLHHRGVDLHLSAQLGVRRGREVNRPRHEPELRGALDLFVDESELLQPPETHLPYGVPTNVVAALVTA